MDQGAGETQNQGDVRSRVLDIIVREGMIDRDKIKGDTTLDDLGVQSIDVVIILNAIEDEFKIYVPIDQTMNDVRTVDELVAAIIALVEKPASGTPAA